MFSAHLRGVPISFTVYTIYTQHLAAEIPGDQPEGVCTELFSGNLTVIELVANCSWGGEKKKKGSRHFNSCPLSTVVPCMYMTVEALTGGSSVYNILPELETRCHKAKILITIGLFVLANFGTGY